MSPLRLLIAVMWLCCATAALSGPARAEPAVVWVALSGQGVPYDEAVDAIRASVHGARAEAELVVRPWRELIRLGGPPPRMVVTVGVAALRGFVDAGPRVPLLATLVPRATYTTLFAAAGQNGRPHSAVWLDQPAGRYFDLLRLALPSSRRVAVIFGPASRIHEQEILRAAAQRKFSVESAHSGGSEQSWAALQSVINDADVLLALPDPQIYNGTTLYNVLNSTYRRRLPVVGFSPAFVTAGALLGLYSTPTQIGTQVGEIVGATLDGRPLPAPQGPHDFSIGINRYVAHSLDISFDADAAQRWTALMHARERAP